MDKIDTIKPGDRIVLTVEMTVRAVNENPASAKDPEGHGPFTAIEFSDEHSGTSYWTLELPTAGEGTTWSVSK